MINNAKHLIRDLKAEKNKIIIPSIVMAELLVHVPEREHQNSKQKITKLFCCVSFCMGCSSIYARLWHQKKSMIKDIAINYQATRQELKADCFIIATAIYQKASLIYSNDKKITKFAQGEIEVKEIPILPHQINFPFDC